MPKGAFYVALDRARLERLLDDHLDGRGAATAPSTSDAAQGTLEVRGRAGGGLMTLFMWLAEVEIQKTAARRSGAHAEALLRGAPELGADEAAQRRLSRAYFGTVFVSPDGGLYRMTKEGLADPHRGTRHAPAWPALPVAGSPIEAIFKAVGGLRTELSFDREGDAGAKVPKKDQLRSLHVKASVDLR
jgi:hypothetical protein